MSFYHGPKGVRFIGSKGKCGGIARVINEVMPTNGTYWEPFVGAAKVIQSVRAASRYGSDLDCHIIKLLNSIKQGWQPPTTVTEADYKFWKQAYRDGGNDPMIGFIGYACSFGGRFFQGFARSRKSSNRNFAASARRSLLRQKPFVADAAFFTQDYRGDNPCTNIDVIYCDPPYAGTQRCGSVTSPFDSAEFWQWAVKKSRNSIVLVSEYACPVKHAVVVWEKSVASGIRFGTGGNGAAKGSGKRKQEKLFLLNPEVQEQLGFGV